MVSRSELIVSMRHFIVAKLFLVLLHPKESKLNDSIVTQLIATHARENSLAGYSITTVYTKTGTEIAATKHLKSALPYLFDLLIGKNWRRKNIFDSFALFAFLNEPGNGLCPRRDAVPIGSVQNSFHHHSILLVEPWIAHRIQERFLWISSSDLPPIAPDDFANHHLAETRVRSCKIQYLSTPDDIEQMTRYAARAVSGLYKLYPDDYLLIAPLYPNGIAASPQSRVMRAVSSKTTDQPWAPKRLSHYEPELRGPAQNRWGGQQTQRLRTYGGKFGAANYGRSLNVDEVERWKRENGS